MSVDAAELRRLRREARLDPASASSVALAEALMRTGASQEALQVLEGVLGRQPGLRSARTLRCRLLLAEGQLAPARAEVEALCAEDPDNVALARVYMDVLLQGRDRVRARAQLGRLAELGVDRTLLQAWSEQLSQLQREQAVPGVKDIFLKPGIAAGLSLRGRREAALRAWRALALVPEHEREAELWMERLEQPIPAAPPRRRAPSTSLGGHDATLALAHQADLLQLVGTEPGRDRVAEQEEVDRVAVRGLPDAVGVRRVLAQRLPDQPPRSRRLAMQQLAGAVRPSQRARGDSGHCHGEDASTSHGPCSTTST